MGANGACSDPTCILCAAPTAGRVTTLLASLMGVTPQELNRRADIGNALLDDLKFAMVRSPDPAMFDALVAEVKNVIRIYALPVQVDGAPTVETPAVSMDTLVNGGQS